MNLQTLKTELTTDPLSRGYSAMNDVAAAESLNTPDRQPARETITAEILVSAIVWSEYVLLTALQKEYIGMILSAGSIQLNATTTPQLGGMFGAGTTTRANILAALKRVGSRAEELGIPGVTPSHVADARRLA